MAEETVSADFLDQVVGQLTLPKLVDAIREGEEYSKAEMATELGVSPSYYSDFLKGEKIPSISKAAEWADTLYHQAQFVELAINDKLRSLGMQLEGEGECPYSVTSNLK